MLGNMMPYQLTINALMRHGKQLFSNNEIISITSDHDYHQCTLADIFTRAAKLANFFQENEIKKGDRIATLAWNDFRHMELYFGVSCSGAVCHTINPRLHPDQLAFIINDAQDQMLFIDVMFIELIKGVESKLSHVKNIVVLTSDDSVIEGLPSHWKAYEQIMGQHSCDYEWPELNEEDACSLCYTSGTTGDPKGVLYSHRALILHTMSAALPDCFGVSKRDVILPVVPMFHVNSWGIPYLPAMVGCKLVFAGHKVANPQVLTHLIQQEKVSITAGVPTVWNFLYDYLKTEKIQLKTLQKMIVGGSAMPPHLYKYYEQEQGLVVVHAWGMTEMSPLGTVNATRPYEANNLNEEELFLLKLKQGHPVFGVEMKIVDEQGKSLDWDGKQSGSLLVRGPWVVDYYFNKPETKTADGWFDTGDISTIDEFGFMKIADRKKDVIKSGGEWISSIDIENAMMMHKQVSMAAVIGLEHPKWGERPLLIIERNAHEELTVAQVGQWLNDKIAKWWIPETVVYVDKISLTATGKVHKLVLREQFSNFKQH